MTDNPEQPGKRPLGKLIYVNSNGEQVEISAEFRLESLKGAKMPSAADLGEFEIDLKSIEAKFEGSSKITDLALVFGANYCFDCRTLGFHLRYLVRSPFTGQTCIAHLCESCAEKRGSIIQKG